MDNGVEYVRKMEEIARRMSNMFFNWIGRPFLKMIGVKGMNWSKRQMEYIKDGSGRQAYLRVLADGAREDVASLGEFDREEMQAIYQDAQKRGVQIVVSVRHKEGDVKSQFMSKDKVEFLLTLTKEKEGLEKEINDIMLSGASEEKKKEKCVEKQKRIEEIQARIKRDYEEDGLTYTLMVNRDKWQFMDYVKNNYLDHDIKAIKKSLIEQIQNRTICEKMINNIKDVQKMHQTAQEDYEVSVQELQQMQKEYDELCREKNNPNLTKEEKAELNARILSMSKVLSSKKAETMDCKKAVELAKEAIEKQSFQGEFTKEALQNAVGNVSMHNDYYDYAHLPEGFATFQMEMEDYYEFVSNKNKVLNENSFAAFKETKDGPVQIICSSQDVQNISTMAKEFSKKPLQVEIHTNDTQLTEVENVNSIQFQIEDEKKLSEILKMYETVHKENGAKYSFQYHTTEKGYDVSVTSTIPNKELTEKHIQYTSQLNEKARQERDKYISQVRKNEKEHFIQPEDTKIVQNGYTKAQEQQIKQSEKLFGNRNSDLYNEEKNAFLHDKTLSAKEMEAYRKGFQNGLSVDDAYSMREDGASIGEIVGDGIGTLKVDIEGIGEE